MDFVLSFYEKMVRSKNRQDPLTTPTGGIYAMQLTGQVGAMQKTGAELGCIFNMGGSGVANYCSILEIARGRT
jgi:hypothetical protein